MEFLNAATGAGYTVEELEKAGERICNAERQFLVRAGFSRKDDSLPPRITSEPLPDGPAKGLVCHLDQMLDQYYKIRGWTPDGIPKEDKLKELGIDFVSLQDKIETTSASGKLMFHIISAFAEFERNIIGDRTKFGMQRKAKEGGFITKAPKGYKLVEKQLVPHDDSDIITEIFKEFLDSDISLTQLAKKHSMTPAGMKKLLKNTTYIGKVRFADIVTDGQHKPIIEVTLFNKVQDKIKDLGWS